MTFIASVIARNGVAIVADSFVTASERSLDEDKLIKYIGERGGTKKSLTFIELASLFEQRPSYTRNYMDKLIKFGKNSAITTTGQAYINGRLIKDIVDEIAIKLDVDNHAVYNASNIEDILTKFCELIKLEVVEHLKKYNLSNTAFIFSHYNVLADKPEIYTINVFGALKGEDISLIKNFVYFEQKTHLKIVTDGQDSFVDRLIFGSLYRRAQDVTKLFVDYMFKTFKPKKARKKEITDCVEHIDFLKETLQSDIFSIQFRELSLQEAVDFAALLMKIVMDIQVYTEKIPTVGGLIRLATISKDKGFQWVSGDQILKPKII